MTKQNAVNTLLQTDAFFKKHGPGYKTWGSVKVVQAAARISEGGYALTPVNADMNDLKEEQIQICAVDKSMFQKIFSTRKNIEVILITEQQYASQIRKEVPAILDDQAQLLGVSVRVARSDNEAPYALKSRFAAILPNQKSICIGNSLDDAFVAAQLLEKTSKVFIEAAVLGGAKPINKIEAWLMQKYYQFKYSKEAVKNI